MKARGDNKMEKVSGWFFAGIAARILKGILI
jgi:hypothetical protein